MAPSIFPPTPAPSTDIKGKEDSHFPGIDNTFELPPAAVSHNEKYQQKAAEMPASPESSTGSRYHSESMPAPDLTSPPATSRSRKISNVKVKSSMSIREDNEGDAAYVPTKVINTTSGRGKGKDTTKGKASAATSAQGRKVARKTAHSIIERRRRSKMNEEFGVLKDLIPACRGVEMHKLAILQASIDYLRHLESNISDLKAGRAQSSEAPSLLDLTHANDQEDDLDDEDNEDQMQIDDDDDVSPTTMTQPTSHHNPQPQRQAQQHTAAPIPALTSSHPQNQNTLHRTSTSPTSASTTTQPSPYFGPLTSASSTSTFSRPSYSATTSPTFGPYYSGSGSGSRSSSMQDPATILNFSALPPSYNHNHNHNNQPHAHAQTQNHSAHSHSHHTHNHTRNYSISNSAYGSRAGSTQTSPVIVPKDQGLNEAEASTALLMLNKDRRHSSVSVPVSQSLSQSQSQGHAAEGKRRGLSVRDLLGS